VDPAVEESDQYRKRMGKWRRDTHDLVQDPVFFSVLTVAERCHGVIDHHMNFLCATFSDEERAQGGLHIARLVCGRADRYLLEYSAALQDLAWAHDAVARCTDPAVRSGVLALIVELSAHHAASFKRRVCMPLSESPP
jgi:hypothetical protein